MAPAAAAVSAMPRLAVRIPAHSVNADNGHELTGSAKTLSSGAGREAVQAKISEPVVVDVSKKSKKKPAKYELKAIEVEVEEQKDSENVSENILKPLSMETIVDVDVDASGLARSRAGKSGKSITSRKSKDKESGGGSSGGSKKKSSDEVAITISSSGKSSKESSKSKSKSKGSGKGGDNGWGPFIRDAMQDLSGVRDSTLVKLLFILGFLIFAYIMLMNLQLVLQVAPIQSALPVDDKSAGGAGAGAGAGGAGAADTGDNGD